PGHPTARCTLLPHPLATSPDLPSGTTVLPPPAQTHPARSAPPSALLAQHSHAPIPPPRCTTRLSPQPEPPPAPHPPHRSACSLSASRSAVSAFPTETRKRAHTPLSPSAPTQSHTHP